MQLRVTPNTMKMESLYRINRQLEEIRDLTNQISSGKALMAPSDGPVDLAMAMRYSTRLDEYSAFEENIQKSREFLEEVDGQMAKANDLVHRARDLAVQAANGTYEEHSREAIAQEVIQIYEELIRTANASVDGRYIFAGNKTSTVPFVTGYDGSDEVIVYKGDNGIRNLEIGENATIEENIPGSELFYNRLTRETLLTDLRNGQGIQDGTMRLTDMNGTTVDIDIMTSNPLDPAYVETVGDVLDLINNNGTADIFAEINDKQTGIIVSDMSGGTASPLRIEDMAGSSSEQLGILRETMSGRIEGKTVDNGDSIFVVVRRLKDALLDDNQVEIYDSLIGDLTNVQKKLLLGRAKAGTRNRTLETINSSNQSIQLHLEEQLYNREDLDVSEAIIELQQHETVYQMALSSAARSIQTTLLNYL